MPFTPITAATQMISRTHVHLTAVPTVLTVVASGFVRLDWLRAFNPTAADIVLTLTDGNGNSIAVIVPAASGGGDGWYGDNIPSGFPMPGGFSVIAGATGLLLAASWY